MIINSMIINSVDDLNIAPPQQQLVLLLGASPGWLGLSASDTASRISALEAAGVEPPPEPVLPVEPPPDPPPDPATAYKALLSTSLFQQVGQAAEADVKITRHYADLGFSLLAQPWGAEATAAAIANLHTAYGFTTEDQAWIAAWVETHNLGLPLPWASN